MKVKVKVNSVSIESENESGFFSIYTFTPELINIYLSNVNNMCLANAILICILRDISLCRFQLVCIGDELTLNDTYPILSDPTFIPDVTEELLKDREWKYKELKGCVLFVWGQLLRICASASPFSGTYYYTVI